MIIVDTNVLVDVIQNNSLWADWSVEQLVIQGKIHELVINPVIYAELAAIYDSREKLDAATVRMGVEFQEFPRSSLYVAGQAYRRYRRQGGPKLSVLPDFFIGAHAAVLHCAVLTRDPRRYRSYFPSVDLITPEGSSGGFWVHEPRVADLYG